MQGLDRFFSRWGERIQLAPVDRALKLQLPSNCNENVAYRFSPRPRAHTSGKNPYGVNVLWGDGHVKFSTTKAAFDPQLWGGTGPNPTPETPGDNETKWRTIVALLRP